MPRLRYHSNNTASGVADPWRPRIRDQRHPLTGPKSGHDRLRRGGLVVSVSRHHRRPYAPGIQQAARQARILGSDDIHPFQCLPSTQSQVGKVADRRGHDVQRAGWPILFIHPLGKALPGVLGVSCLYGIVHVLSCKLASSCQCSGSSADPERISHAF